VPKVLDLPKPPSGLGHCQDCRCWLSKAKTGAVKLPNGAVIPRETYDRASTIVAGAVEFVQAPCAHSPQWVVQPAEGWCWQWAPITIN
jgi:hypothetical protein